MLALPPADKGNSTAGTSTSGSSSGSSTSGGAISQLVVRDGESWERWWAMERVLLGTIRNSGQRMAQYIGGHSVSKQHRNSGSSSRSGNTVDIAPFSAPFATP